MEIAKPNDADRDWFRSLVPNDSRVEVKAMFGNLGAFVNGNMFMGLFGADVGVRLAESDRQSLMALGGGSFGPAERPMGGYTSLPAEWRGNAEANDSWVDRALDYVGAMPPKAPKPAKAAKPPKR